MRFSLLTIAAMLALGYTTERRGLDSTLGLAFAHAGWFYPFFGTMLGWLGVALTGSDTSSNVLFGGLQKVSAEQLGLSPVLMAAANSSGGVMGKMIDAQSIVVASTATQWYGHEGDILRYVFFHSLALAALMGLLIMAQAYVWPFTALVGALTGGGAMPDGGNATARLRSPYDALYRELAAFIDPARLITDPLRLLTWGTDASFYRLVPAIAVVVNSEEEVRRLLAACAGHGTPVTFRAAGTSLSGQAITDSVLMLLGDNWRRCEVGGNGETITLQPGVIGAAANRSLARFGRKIGPDPASIDAAMIGGIAANNASGMCCGTAQNSYHTVAGIRVVLADGTVLDTRDPASRAAFREHKGELVAAARRAGPRGARTTKRSPRASATSSA